MCLPYIGMIGRDGSLMSCMYPSEMHFLAKPAAVKVILSSVHIAGNNCGGRRFRGSPSACRRVDELQINQSDSLRSPASSLCMQEGGGGARTVPGEDRRRTRQTTRQNDRSICRMSKACPTTSFSSHAYPASFHLICQQTLRCSHGEATGGRDACCHWADGEGCPAQQLTATGSRDDNAAGDSSGEAHHTAAEEGLQHFV
jgi:hypothetical protein